MLADQWFPLRSKQIGLLMVPLVALTSRSCATTFHNYPSSAYPMFALRLEYDRTYTQALDLCQKKSIDRRSSLISSWLRLIQELVFVKKRLHKLVQLELCVSINTKLCAHLLPSFSLCLFSNHSPNTCDPLLERVFANTS